MAIKSWNIIGLMSGSSLDGVDIANCHFLIEDNPEFRIINWEITKGEIFPFLPKTLDILNNVTNLNALELIEFDRELGSCFGEMVNAFCLKYNIIPDCIASHGHTVYHYPSKGYTLQIGHPANIAATTDYPVIGDFRSMDVALGGQGAPFAPIADLLLFNKYDALINIGGIVNLCFIKNDNQLIAYDLCPGNQVLDYLARLNGMPYDSKGQQARKGKLHPELYNKLAEWPYFKLPFPKSLDNSEIVTTFLPLLNSFEGSVEDKLHTMVLLIGVLVKQAFDSSGTNNQSKVLISGGGAFNDFLIEVIKNQLAGVEVVVPEEKIVNFKEALLMALMGLLRIYNQNNVLSLVTGSRLDHCAGAIYPGRLKLLNEHN